VSTVYARRNRPNSIAAVAANPSTRNGISRPEETRTAETIPVTTGNAPTSTMRARVVPSARRPPRTAPSGPVRKMTAKARLARRDNPDAVHRSARRLTTPRVTLAPVRLANCSPVPSGSSNGSTSSASPINARPTSESARVDRNSWYASAAAWVLTSSARERAPMARSSASDRDCARVAILGSMARGAS
jgi:hypothetical protein